MNGRGDGAPGLWGNPTGPRTQAPVSRALGPGAVFPGAQAPRAPGAPGGPSGAPVGPRGPFGGPRYPGSGPVIFGAPHLPLGAPWPPEGPQGCRSQELRRAPRGGGVREKNPRPLEGPWKTPRCLRVRSLFLHAPGGPQGLLCPRPSRTPGTSRPQPGAGPPGVPTCPGCRVIRAFSLTPPESPQDSWGPPGTGREGGRETASVNNLHISVYGNIAQHSIKKYLL